MHHSHYSDRESFAGWGSHRGAQVCERERERQRISFRPSPSSRSTNSPAARRSLRASKGKRQKTSPSHADCDSNGLKERQGMTKPAGVRISHCGERTKDWNTKVVTVSGGLEHVLHHRIGDLLATVVPTTFLGSLLSGQLTLVPCWKPPFPWRVGLFCLRRSLFCLRFVSFTCGRFFLVFPAYGCKMLVFFFAYSGRN